MVTAEQKQRILKAKIALALRDEFGKVPKSTEIEYTYHLARVLYKAVLGTRYLKRQQHKIGQRPIF
jgi:DNA invertase Pin-like site-specific DNA recombinase